MGKQANLERRKAMVEAYRSGKTLEECGRIFSVTGEAIRRSLKASGLTRRRFWKKPKPAKLTSEQKFWARIKISKDADECWIWRGYLHQNGYGRAYVNGKSGWAHRIAFELHYGYRPMLHVLHSCDNPPCCNPNHLREGTPADNMRDRDMRGRAAWQKDYEGWRTKLILSRRMRKGRKYSDREINEIRRRYMAGELARSLAFEFKTYVRHIVRIARGDLYKFDENGNPMPVFEPSDKVHPLFRRRLRHG
jgi:hypothetical protein